ncbi:glutathione S-transferase family protein [Sphingomonas sp. BAUL-RG-20F-R05-02]|uniref:glutathione S-transferase family protein n=1 Tax=Sphingomonas sp. BAUL-RG-20F-R05-02 TaxID=2914830 RepID=UPI001F5AE6B7|nr:glutathione S-transferase [Sphingomonas sp. BAUL-RG-20F-R05-02]
MIQLHYLERSRAIRILWLLEELGTDFELVEYQRDANHRAPASLKDVHPLGKSPVIVDGDLVLAESSAILRYIDARYGANRFSPPKGSDAAAIHDEWLDYVEGSAAFPIMLTLIGGMTGGLSEKMDAFVTPGREATLRYIAVGVGEGPLLMGEQLTLADMQMFYLLQVADRAKLLAGYPALTAYLARLTDQPGLKRALARAGEAAS